MRYLLVLLLAVCLIGCESPVDGTPALAELEVVNGVDLPINRLFLWDCKEGEWSENLVYGNPIMPGESSVFEVKPSLYDIKAKTNKREYRITTDITLDGYLWIVEEPEPE